LNKGSPQRVVAAVVTLLAMGGCSAVDGNHPGSDAPDTFRAVIVMVDLPDDPALWRSCDSDPVLHDGEEVILSVALTDGGERVAGAQLADGGRIPLRDTFADDPAFARQPVEAKACTWRIAIPQVTANRSSYTLRVGHFTTPLSAAQVSNGVRLAISTIGGDSVKVHAMG
jgi:hypothetical protein